MIKTELVTKFYKKNSNVALENFSYEFCDNTITGLLGVNGAGKSTLLKILSLQLYPTSGTILIDGKDAENNRENLKEKIGFVSENPQFYEDFKVKELLKNTLDFYSNLSSYDEIVKKCSLQDVTEKKIKTLSKGYRQRLSFALALANNPQILILDEPISGLDPVQISEIRNLITSFVKEKKNIVIFSTHIISEVNAICDKIVILNNGKIVSSGTEQEILKKTGQENIEKAFIFLTKET